MGGCSGKGRSRGNELRIRSDNTFQRRDEISFTPRLIHSIDLIRVMDTVLAGKAVPEYIYLIRSKYTRLDTTRSPPRRPIPSVKLCWRPKSPGIFFFLSFFLHVSPAKMTVLAPPPPRDRTTSILECSSRLSFQYVMHTHGITRPRWIDSSTEQGIKSGRIDIVDVVDAVSGGVSVKKSPRSRTCVCILAS